LGYVPQQIPDEPDKIIKSAYLTGDTQMVFLGSIYPLGLPVTKYPYADYEGNPINGIAIRFHENTLREIIKEVILRDSGEKITYTDLAPSDTINYMSRMGEFLTYVGNKVGGDVVARLLVDFFKKNITVCKVESPDGLKANCLESFPFEVNLQRLDWSAIHLTTAGFSPNSCYALQIALVNNTEHDFLGTFCIGNTASEEGLYANFVYRVNRKKLDENLKLQYGIEPRKDLIEYARGKEEFASVSEPNTWSYMFKGGNLGSPRNYYHEDLLGTPLFTYFHYNYEKAGFVGRTGFYYDDPSNELYFFQSSLDVEDRNFMLIPQVPLNPFDLEYYKKATLRTLISDKAKSFPPIIFESEPGIIEFAGLRFESFVGEQSKCNFFHEIRIIAGGSANDIGCIGCNYDYKDTYWGLEDRIDITTPPQTTILRKSVYEFAKSSYVEKSYLGIRVNVMSKTKDRGEIKTCTDNNALLRAPIPLTQTEINLLNQAGLPTEIIAPKILEDARTQVLNDPDPFVQLRYGYKVPDPHEMDSWDKKTRDLFIAKILVPSLVDTDNNYLGARKETLPKERFFDDVFKEGIRANGFLDLHFSEERNDKRPAGQQIADISERELLTDLFYLSDSDENMGEDFSHIPRNQRTADQKNKHVQRYIAEEHLKFATGFLRANMHARDALMLVHHEFRNIILGAKEEKIPLANWSQILEIILTKYFLWKKYFEHPRYDQNWFSQFISDVRGGIQERKERIDEKFVFRHTTDEGSFSATMNYTKDAKDIAEAGVWNVLDSFIFAGLESASDWGYLSSEQRKLQLDPRIGDSTLAEFMLYLEAIGAATIFLPPAKGTIRGAKAAVSASLKGGSKTLIKEGEKKILEVAVHSLPDRSTALASVHLEKTVMDAPSLAPLSRSKSALQGVRERATQSLDWLTQRFGFKKTTDGKWIRLYPDSSAQAKEIIEHNLKRHDITRYITTTVKKETGLVKGSSGVEDGEAFVEVLSHIHPVEYDFFKDILVAKYRPEFFSDRLESIKGFLSRCRRHDLIVDEELQTLTKLAENQDFSKLIMKLQEKGIIDQKTKVQFLTELSITSHEAEHAVQHVFGTHLVSEKILARYGFPEDEIVRITKTGNFQEMLEALRSKFSSKIDPVVFDKIGEDFDKARDIIMFAQEKYAYREQRKLLLALADDDVFRDVVIKKGKNVEINPALSNSLDRKLTVGYWEPYFGFSDDVTDKFILDTYKDAKKISSNCQFDDIPDVFKGSKELPDFGEAMESLISDILLKYSL